MNYVNYMSGDVYHVIQVKMDKKCRMPLHVIVATISAVGHEQQCLLFGHKTVSKMRTNKLRFYKGCGEKYTSLGT